MSFTFSSRGLLTTIATVAALATAPLSAQSITQSNSGAPIYGFGNAGAGYAATVGQSFVAAGPMLYSFSFWLSNEGSFGNTPNAEQLTFRAYLAEWDGTAIVGPLLFQSALQSGPVSFSQAYTFDDGVFMLNAGSTYIAFLTVDWLGQLDATAAVEASDDTESGGQFFFSYSGDVYALESGAAAWEDGADQLHFQAMFAPIVPEPATGLLLGAGLLLLVAAGRRRQAATRA